MTIKGLKAFLKKRTPHAFRRVPVEFFGGKWVAVDGFGLCYSYLSSALSIVAKNSVNSAELSPDRSLVIQRWLSRWVVLITLFREAGFHPCIVMDGPDIPSEKAQTRAKRKEGREEVAQRITALKGEITSEELSFQGESRKELAKLIGRELSFQEGELALLYQFLRELGVCVVQAEGEGEALCCTLVKEGKCVATYMEDSDYGAYQAPVIITELESPSYLADGTKRQYCSVLYYQQVLRTLGLTPEQMVDLAIMSGTDYNENVPNFGVVKCYHLLVQYGRLEDIPLEKYDPTILNYQRVREIFTKLYQIREGSLEEAQRSVGEVVELLQRHKLSQSGKRLVSLLKGAYLHEVPLSKIVADASLNKEDLRELLGK